MLKKINWSKALSIVSFFGMLVTYAINFIKEKLAQQSEDELIKRIAEETSEKVIDKIEGMKSV